VDELRKWTSSEALGDVTVLPDNTMTVEQQEDPVDHLLPSPEEQMMAVAMRYVQKLEDHGHKFNMGI